MIGVGWVEPRVLYGGGYPGDGEAGAVGLDMEAAVGYDGCREGVEALSERYVHACVEEPAGEGGSFIGCRTDIITDCRMLIH